MIAIIVTRNEETLELKNLDRVEIGTENKEGDDSMKAAVGGVVFAALMMSACTREDGPLENAGERVDEAVENVKEGDSPFRKKGAGEKAGEAVDRAIDRATDK